MKQKEVLIMLVAIAVFAVFFMNTGQNSGDLVTGDYKYRCPLGYSKVGHCDDTVIVPGEYYLPEYGASDASPRQVYTKASDYCDNYCREKSNGACVGSCTDTARPSKRWRGGYMYDCECVPRSYSRF